MSGSVYLGLYLDIKQMSLQIRQPGIVLRDEEAIRLKGLLKDTHNDFIYVSERIKKEEMRMETIMKAIQMAEPPLAEAKKSLEVHEISLGSLLSIQEQIISLYPVPTVPNVDTPESHRLSNVLETSARVYQARIAPGLTEQIDLVRAEKEETKGRVHILEAEVDGLRLALDQAKRIHEVLLTSLPSIGEVFTVVSKALMPISKVPAEVWTAIFKLIIRADVNYDRTRDPNSRYRNTVVIFMHVCRFWRDIVMKEPQLWTFVVAPSPNQLRLGETKLLDMALGRTQSPLTLLLHHDQLLESHDYYHQLRDGSKVDLLQDKEFGIIVDTDTEDFTSEVLKISTYCSQWGFRRRPCIQSTLHIWEQHLTQLQDAIISIQAGQLMTLTLEFQLFGNKFPIDFNSIRSLVELHIRQEADQDLPRIQNLAFRQLRILGITAPAINFIENLQVPLLERLIYYGPMDPFKVEVPAGDNGLTKYRHLTSIEFEDWKESKLSQWDDVLAGAVGLFGNVLLQTRSLRRVKFADSYVDGRSLLGAFGIGDARDGIEAVDGVEEVTLSYCWGITRDECDQLKAVVKKLNIYV